MVHMRILSGVMVLAAMVSMATGQTKATFDNADGIKEWKVQGDVTVDAEKNRDGAGGGALKLGPMAEARLKLRETNGGGKVEFWVFEDGTFPADPKAGAAGAMWGLMGKDGNVVIVGALYAKYLAGDTTYAASDWNPEDKKDPPFARVQYLGTKRDKGWHKWTFEMDPEKGLTISHNGKDINQPKKRFDWNKTKLDGFAGVVVFGDRTPGGQQMLWVDDLTAELGGEMKAQAVAPPPPPPAFPATDPAVEKKTELRAALKGKHPRLLFTAEDLPKLRESANGEGKVFWDQLMGYLPVSRAPNTVVATDATDAQRQGLWRAPTVAVHYAVTGDKKSFEAAKGMLEWMVKHDSWEDGSERDSGMGASNIAIGAGILYDVLYNDLDPEFREKARQKLLLQARKQWYLGHENGNKAVAYWQGDPQNNHRWHRNAGMAMCALGVAGDGPGDEFILSKLQQDLDYVAQWLPPDGTSHESPSYMVFGAPHLYLAMDAADRCLGTKYLDHPFFKNIPMYRLHTLTPGLKDTFDYGDAGGTGGINSFVFRSTGHHKLADLQDAMLKFYQATSRQEDGRVVNRSFEFGVYSFLWFDPSVKGGSIDKLPKNCYFDDLGLAFARDGWAENNVGMFFKCAPYGGYLLNEYRRTKGLNSNVNVAHDDPDVNMFQIFANGKMLARDDGYAKDKVTSSHNTILVNGRGQRGEGGVWMQPLKNFDMAQLGVMTTWKDAGDIVIAEGEGAGAYVELHRYRRSAIWVKGGYILILDDIRGGASNEITWLVQGDDLTGDDGRYQLKSGQASCDFSVTADTALSSTIGTSTADHRGKNQGLKQLQAKATAQSLRVAAVFDPWKRGDLKVELKATGADHATVVVTGKGINDTWTWAAAPAMTYTASTLKCERAGKLLVEAGPADQAHIPYKDLPPIQAAQKAAPARRR